MLLIDSLYINNSGGFRLLDYLVKELIKRAIPFYLLADGRCLGKLDFCERVEYLKASMKNRYLFYRKHRNDFKTILCFGNIPPPMKLSVPVYTYYHNVNLLTLAEADTVKKTVIAWMKRLIFRFFKKNTDLWVVQTTNTATELKKHLCESEEKVRILPFYDLPEDLYKLQNANHGDDYVYISNYTGAKGHEELLEAWCKLHERGVDRALHLTVRKSAVSFVGKIKEAQEKGVCVVNHGLIPFDEVIDLYRFSKAIVYPSHNESLGLGIIEAITAGCDVIGADLPYIHSICKPSVTFDPYDSDSIADAIVNYETSNNDKSELTIHNCINELISLMTGS